MTRSQASREHRSGSEPDFLPRSGLLGASLATLVTGTLYFSWFSSADDTDDWSFRVVTIVQMVGVLVLATGLPRMFASIEHGRHLDNSIMVFGYVIMRVAPVF
jgi:Bacterial low temperature requirement A protein (LtrA)